MINKQISRGLFRLSISHFTKWSLLKTTRCHSKKHAPKYIYLKQKREWPWMEHFDYIKLIKAG